MKNIWTFKYSQCPFLPVIKSLALVYGINSRNSLQLCFAKDILVIIWYLMHCFMLQLNKESNFFINYYRPMQQSENPRTCVDGRELEHFSVPGFFIPYRFFSVLYFCMHLKSLCLFWLLSVNCKVLQRTAELLNFLLSLSFCKNVYLSLSVTPSKSIEVWSLSACEREIALLCLWMEYSNQSVSPLTNFVVEDLHVKW